MLPLARVPLSVLISVLCDSVCHPSRPLLVTPPGDFCHPSRRLEGHNVRFSNRPFWSSAFRLSTTAVFNVAHGLALLFGSGTLAALYPRYVADRAAATPGSAPWRAGRPSGCRRA